MSNYLERYHFYTSKCFVEKQKRYELSAYKTIVSEFKEKFNLLKSIFNFLLNSFALFFVWMTNLQISAVDLQCDIYKGLWAYQTEPTNTYCSVKNLQIFQGDRVFLDSVDGQSSNELANSFYLQSPPNLIFFPQNLENIFPNLIGISISSSQLTEVTQNDLKVFSQLKYLWLPHNQIKYLRGDVFAYNTKLEVVVMYSNLIAHIDPTMFNNLSELRVLNLAKNECKSLTLTDTRLAVETQVKKIQNKECTTNQNNGDVILKTTPPTTVEPTTEDFISSSTTTTTEEILTTTDESLEIKLEEKQREIDELKKQLADLAYENEKCLAAVNFVLDHLNKIKN